MSHQVLARKWRPKSFETLVGQPHVVRALSNALAQQRIHHAYLFTGTRGVGKTTIARIIAKSLNCETGITAKPCGVCNACTEIDLGRFVDLLEVDAASNTQVDAMRELLENAQYAPTSGRFKVYIIDEVHMLSKSAFNAMLKTLEEPPEHVKFILATTDPQKVPITVLSRCLQFNLRQIASPTIAEHLQAILTKENIPFEDAGMQLIARAAEGSMRDALSLTDQAIAYGNQAVNEADVRSMLGAIDQSYLFDLLHALLNEDGVALISKAQEMQTRSISFEAALNDLAKLLHQIAIAQMVPESISHDLPEREVLLQLAENLPADKLQLYYQIALLGGRDISLAPDEYAGFTMSLLRMLAFSPVESLAAQKKNSLTPVASAIKTSPIRNATVALNRNSDQSTSPNNTPVEAKPSLMVQALLKSTNDSEPSNDSTKINVDIQPASTEALTHVVAHFESEAEIAKPSIAEQTAQDETVESIAFDGHWRNLIESHLKLGIARALAQNCEMLSYDDDNIYLRVAEKQKHLVSATYQEKLSHAINQHYGRTIKLHFQVDHEANTPAMEQAEEKAVIQTSAEEAIMRDPFVQALLNDFDAKIIPNSIKPIQ
ncbi:MAG: DNA polymerase III subunit gamma/tau [Methylophilaceae bacterium]|nr:DNA polymerase III subunit gamma/tau [Methylophilaceae bacterium]MDG1820693.1 DNA polymerase III subunit gamma/tau [Methylophilaceae bacterium]